jgi:HxlR-like helix-turn-helix
MSLLLAPLRHADRRRRCLAATLSDRLKHLEDYELVERRQYQTSPERYEYLLTAKGRDTILVLQALLQVGDKWAVSGDAGPPLRFVDRKTGHPVNLRGSTMRPANASSSRTCSRKQAPAPMNWCTGA